jgi:hypothetical protein
MSSASLLLFAGAPRSSTLDWERPNFLDTFSEPFARFSGWASIEDKTQTPPIPLHPPWRSIPLERRHLATGHSQGPAWQGASFFTTSAVGSFLQKHSPEARDLSQTTTSESAEELLSQFFEQSYARHNDIMSSQLATASDAGLSHSNSDSSLATNSSTSFTLSMRAKEIPLCGNLSDLKDIPTAPYLNSIHPQTVTVNLIIGIISVQAPRPIKTRHGADVQLIEVLVGDESKSGFGISFWLPVSQPVQGDMRNVLDSLRPQDVVLMQNIALNSFRGKVYGQSLRRGMTKVQLLYRNRIGRTDPGGCYNAADLASTTALDSHIDYQIKKTARVREWSLKFVKLGDSKSGRASTLGSILTQDCLPPDTQ